MKQKPDDDLRQIKANWGNAIAALDCLPLLVIGVVLGVAGVLSGTPPSKLLSRDLEG